MPPVAQIPAPGASRTWSMMEDKYSQVHRKVGSRWSQDSQADRNRCHLRDVPVESSTLQPCESIQSIMKPPIRSKGRRMQWKCGSWQACQIGSASRSLTELVQRMKPRCSRINIALNLNTGMYNVQLLFCRFRGRGWLTSNPSISLHNKIPVIR